jgi:hypothetical protein
VSFYVFGNPMMQSYDRLRLQAESRIMSPGHQMAVDVATRPTQVRGLEVVVALVIDGQEFPIDHRIWTPDQLADHYELAHHQLHGYDPRGLDPRVERTRLKP